MKVVSYAFGTAVVLAVPAAGLFSVDLSTKGYRFSTGGATRQVIPEVREIVVGPPRIVRDCSTKFPPPAEITAQELWNICEANPEARYQRVILRDLTNLECVPGSHLMCTDLEGRTKVVLVFDVLTVYKDGTKSPLHMGGVGLQDITHGGKIKNNAKITVQGKCEGLWQREPKDGSPLVKCLRIRYPERLTDPAPVGEGIPRLNWGEREKRVVPSVSVRTVSR